MHLKLVASKNLSRPGPISDDRIIYLPGSDPACLIGFYPCKERAADATNATNPIAVQFLPPLPS